MSPTMSRETRSAEGVLWLTGVPAEWSILPLFAVVGLRREPNTGMVEDNLLSLSYGNIVRKDIGSSEGLLPASYETYQIVHPGDIVFRFTDLQNDQRSLRSGLALERGIITSAYVVAAPRPDRIESNYFSHLMRAYDSNKVFYGQSGGVRQGLTFSDVRRLPVLLPPLDEQRVIAEYLDDATAKIDTLISKQTEMLRLLEERKVSEIAHAVAGLRSPHKGVKQSGLNWAPSIAEHIQVANIRRFAAMRTGHTPSRGIAEYWVDCTIPWFTLADVWQLRPGTVFTVSDETASRISELGLANSSAELLPAGTVMLSRTASVGFSGVMPVPMATSQDFWNWVCGPQLLPKYLLWTFRAMKPEFDAIKAGSTHQTIYQPIAAALRMPVPSVDEQHEIVDYLDSEVARIDALIAKTREHMALAKERRSALITAAVTGQIDVRTATRRGA